MTPEFLAMIKDVKPARDEEIERLEDFDCFPFGRSNQRDTVLSLIARIVAERKVDDAMVKRVHKRMMSELFLVCQPHRGDVFSFMDDHEDVVRAALSALEERGS